MRRIIAALVAALLLTSIVACDADKKPAAKPTATHAPAVPAPPVPGGNHHQPTPGGQQPAPVQADPSAHNTQPGMVGLFGSWESVPLETASRVHSGQGRAVRVMGVGEQRHPGL